MASAKSVFFLVLLAIAFSSSPTQAEKRYRRSCPDFLKPGQLFRCIDIKGIEGGKFTVGVWVRNDTVKVEFLPKKGFRVTYAVGVFRCEGNSLFGPPLSGGGGRSVLFMGPVSVVKCSKSCCRRGLEMAAKVKVCKESTGKCIRVKKTFLLATLKCQRPCKRHFPDTVTATYGLYDMCPLCVCSADNSISAPRGDDSKCPTHRVLVPVGSG